MTSRASTPLIWIALLLACVYAWAGIIKFAMERLI